MGVYRVRAGSVGRPFKKGNPGGGRPKGVPNKATQEIRTFAREYLESDRYRRSLEQRIEAGRAPHMEVLLHHYAFGQPKNKYVPAAPAPQSQMAAAMERTTKEETLEMYHLAKRMEEIQRQALARPAAPSTTAMRPVEPVQHGS
jgi:hypothetical protein